MNRKSGMSVKGGMGWICSARHDSRDSRFTRYSLVSVFPLTPYFDVSDARLAFQACRARGGT